MKGSCSCCSNRTSTHERETWAVTVFADSRIGKIVVVLSDSAWPVDYFDAKQLYIVQVNIVQLSNYFSSIDLRSKVVFKRYKVDQCIRLIIYAT